MEKQKWAMSVVALPIKMTYNARENSVVYNQLVFHCVGYVMASSFDEALGMAKRVAAKLMPKEGFNAPMIKLGNPNLVPITDPEFAEIT